MFCSDLHPIIGSSVDSFAGCESRGCEFEPQLWQHVFRRLSQRAKRHTFSISGLTVYVEMQLVAWKDCCVVYWCGKTKQNLDRLSGRRDMTERTKHSTLRNEIYIQIVLD